MGCITSKQKTVYSNLEEVSSSSKLKPTSKPKSTTKPKKSIKSKKTCDNDVIANGANRVDLTVQRSITPPPSSEQKETKQPMKLKKTTRKTWTDEELLCQLKFLDFDVSSNIVRLFDEGNTIPFMCRYRRELIGNRDADE